MVIVTKDGFRTEEAREFVAYDALVDGEVPAPGSAVDLPSDADFEVLLPHIGNIAIIRIAFPNFSDGRGFSLAMSLLESGYAGHLRASGHVISDQFRHALQCGFDDVEIDDALSDRQPEQYWRVQEWPSYRQKLASSPG